MGSYVAAPHSGIVVPATAIACINGGTTANASNSQSISAAGLYTCLAGFSITGSGATAASVVTAQLSGTNMGNIPFAIAVPAGVTTGITPIIVEFIPALNQNTLGQYFAITVPAFGAGNTNCSVAIWGYALP